MLMHPRYTVLGGALLCAAHLFAQPCAPLATAAVGPVLEVNPQGNTNRSAVVWNPGAQLYYSFDAGSADYPAETYAADGTPLSAIAQGFDYRGAWWNPATEQLEGNGFFEGGIFVQDLDPNTHYPLGTGTVILSAAQPDAQSVGALDTDVNEIIYYFNGSIHRYDRSTNAPLATVALSGIPVNAQLNNNTVVYLGCAGNEVGVYDHANRRLLLVNKQTGAYSGMCQLPGDAPQRSSFGMSYSNGYFWLFDVSQNPYRWRGYGVVSSTAGTDERTVQAPRCYPVPARDVLNVENARPVLGARVLDMLGRPVLPEVPLSSGLTQLSVRALSPGGYVLELRTDAGLARTAFVVER